MDMGPTVHLLNQEKKNTFNRIKIRFLFKKYKLQPKYSVLKKVLSTPLNFKLSNKNVLTVFLKNKSSHYIKTKEYKTMMLVHLNSTKM